MWIGLLALLFVFNSQVFGQSCIISGPVYAPSCSSMTSPGYGYPGMPVPSCPRNPARNDAVFYVKGIPESARMWVDNHEVPAKNVRQPNGDLRFRTPTLIPGTRYYYTLYVLLPSDTRYRVITSSFCAGDDVTLNSTHWGITPPPPPTQTAPPPPDLDKGKDKDKENPKLRIAPNPPLEKEGALPKDAAKRPPIITESRTPGK